MLDATLVHIEAVTTTTKTFWFRPDKPLHYTAGQFTELYLPHADQDMRGNKRWFTFSSSPTQPLLGITTRFSSASSTFKQTLQQLPIGSRVRLAEPMGDFVLPKDRRVPLLFVAAGLGITPVQSMLQFLQDTGEQRSITLVYIVRSHADTAFASLFSSRSDLQFLPVVSQTGTYRSQKTVDTVSTHVTTYIQTHPKCLIYLSGPEQTVEALGVIAEECGLPKYRIISDFFPGYPSL